MTTRWLDAEERHAWMGLLASTALLDAAMDDQLRRDAGITHTTYSILAGLSEAPQPTLHMHQLALITSHSASRLSHAVTRMESEGWVTRSPCPHNGRAVHATLTRAGRAFVRSIAPGHVQTVRRLVFDRLSAAQVKQLTRISGAVLDALAAEGYPVPGLAAED